jgi:hypothetical protein
MKGTVLSLVIFLGMLSLAKGQTISGELRKVRDAYLKNPQLSFDVSAYSYKTKTDQSPELISTGHVKKLKDNYYSAFLNYLFLANKNKALIIDKTDKTIDYYEYSTQKQALPKSFAINVDSLIFGSDSIAMHPVKNGLRQFTIFDRNDDVQQTELYVDEKTNFIRRILFYYTTTSEDFEAEMDHMDVYYKNIQVSAIPESFFNTDAYIKKINGVYYGVNAYKGFKVNYYNSNSQL